MKNSNLGVSKLFRHVVADIALLMIGLLCYLHVPISLVDDSFISYRYAANLAHGYGLVFNPDQRVEGISDLSWTVLMAIPELLHMRPELFAIAIGVFSAATAFVVARRTAVASLGVPPLLAFLLIALISFNCDFWIMAGNGIESGLYALVLVSSVSLLCSGHLCWSGVLLGFATTLRPESLALAPLSVICAGFLSLWRSRSTRDFLATVRQYRAFSLSWALIVLSVLVWRHAYYGEWVQNTLIAKSHPLHFSDFYAGISYAFRFALRSAPWLVVSLYAMLIGAPTAIIISIAWLAFQLAVVLPNAGDWMPGYRLLSVYLPVMALISASVVSRVFPRKSFRSVFFGALLVSSCAVQFRDRRWSGDMSILRRHTLVDLVGVDENSFINVADALKPALTPKDVVSPEILGAFSYLLLNIPMHDFLGLVDAHVAHHGTVYLPMYGKAEPAYSVETVAPAVFVLVRGDNTLKLFQRDTSGRFGIHYSFWLVKNRPQRIMLAMRRDREQALLKAIRNSGLQIEQIPN